MSNLTRYNFKITEDKWQSYWEKNNFFKVENNSKKKKNFIALRCSLILLAKYTWDM